MTLSAIAAHQAAPTENTLAEINKLLNYVAIYPEDGITYQASSMILAAHLDASYFSEPTACSCAGAHIFVSKDDPIPRPNGPILSIAWVIKLVMASAAEAALVGLFITLQEMVPLQNTLIEMGWPQPKLPIQVDKSMATSLC